MGKIKLLMYIQTAGMHLQRPMYTRALYRERCFLTSEDAFLLSGHIKNAQKILALLEALWLPKKVAIIHCQGHQKGDHSEARKK
jgi:hypothetical protein